MSVALWRIALASRTIAPTDLSGLGAENTGGRWNSAGRPVVYAATSASLACLETVVHLNAGGLPLNRVLVRIDVPDEVWNLRQSLSLTSLPEGWNAVPAADQALHEPGAAVAGNDAQVESTAIAVAYELARGLECCACRFGVRRSWQCMA